jgi:imidazolonepropionase-like amidohydrolase
MRHPATRPAAALLRAAALLALALLPAPPAVAAAAQGGATETAAGATPVTAILAGHLVDPETGTAATGKALLVAGDAITAVVDRADVPAGATVIDLSAAWVLPGLIDAHTHLTWGVPPSPPGESVWMDHQVKESTALRALSGLYRAQSVLRAGFTTVKEIGNAGDYADSDLRRAIEAGWFPGPTIVNCGKIIAPFGGQSSHIAPEQGPLWQYEYIDADGPEEVVKAVRRNLYYGARAIKLAADNGPYYYTEAEVRAAVEEAGRAGVTVAVHALTDEPARQAILGGATSIEHGIFLSDEVLELMKEHGTVLVGTDFPAAHLAALGGVIGEDPERFAAAFLDRLRRAHALGVPMAFGTDVVIDLPGETRGEMMQDYFAVWKEAGVPGADLVRAATVDAARLLRVDGQRGTLAEGKKADVIAVAADPLADPLALAAVVFVMKNGVVIRHDGG